MFFSLCEAEIVMVCREIQPTQEHLLITKQKQNTGGVNKKLDRAEKPNARKVSKLETHGLKGDISCF